MTEDELQRLLLSSESALLDSKRNFPQGLLGGKGSRDWDKGRTTILKDLVAIANGDGPGPGYLVYGVKPAAHCVRCSA